MSSTPVPTVGTLFATRVVSTLTLLVILAAMYGALTLLKHWSPVAFYATWVLLAVLWLRRQWRHSAAERQATINKLYGR